MFKMLPLVSGYFCAILCTELDIKSKQNIVFSFLVRSYENQIEICYIRQHHQMTVTKDSDAV
jgi:hypothetical protein